MISAYRSRAGVFSLAAKPKILGKLEYMTSRSLLCDLFPPKAAARQREFENLWFISKGERKTVARGRDPDEGE